MKTWPTLYKLSATEKIMQWAICAGFGNISVTWGYLNGKLQSATYSCEATNVGKANERDEEAQAEFEATAQWEHKKEYEQYFETINEAATSKKELLTKGDGGPVPMKAHRWRDHEAKMKFPCFVQPKINGLRCVAVCKATGGAINAVALYTSSGKIISGFWPLCHELSEVMNPGDILDGELYCKDMPLQKISGLVRKVKLRDMDEANKLQYWIFDAIQIGDFNKEDIFENRFKEFARRLSLKDFKYIMKVSTYRPACKEAADIFYKGFVANDFEGIMYRAQNANYEQKRSYKILKRKDFQDDEFRILRPNLGTKDSTLDLVVSFVCVTEGGEEFDAPLCGTEAYRRNLANDKSVWEGKWLTVRYLELSPDGIPQIPKGTAIRAGRGQD